MKNTKNKTMYLYTEDQDAMEVLAVEVMGGDYEEAEKKAKKKAKKIGKKLAGGLFTSDYMPPYFDRMTVIKVRRDTKPLEEKPDGRRRKPLLECGIDDDWGICADMLTDIMAIKSGNAIYWKVKGENMGWCHRSGNTVVRAKTGQELLNAILPDTDCSWDVYNLDRGKGLMIKNYHHDAPMGEIYRITPITERTFNNFFIN